MPITFATNEDIDGLNNRIDSISVIPTDSKYFDIDYDGLVSLKPEYRGKCNSTVAAHPYAISDNGVSKDGSKLSELPKKIVIPEVIDGTAVAGFQNGMFYYNYQVEEIVIPSTVTVIPESFCRNAKHLVSIKGTENVTSIGASAFLNCRIEKVLFPKLRTAGTNCFGQCALLHTIDIGDYITTLPEKFLRMCSSLSYVKGGASVKTIAKNAFFYTLNLKNLSFLPNVTSIGDTAFYDSRIQFDWSLLSGKCTFGTNATPVADNTTDYWSACTYTPCENRLVSLLNQKNPEWASDYFGTVTGSTYTYKNGGCSVMAILHIHSALTGKKYSSPKELEAELAAIDSTLLSKHPAYINNADTILKALGYNTTLITSDLIQSNLQNVYNALASGAYVFVAMSSESNVNSGHAVILYGINDIGEVLVADTDAGLGNLEIYEASKYRVPFQNITGPSSDLIIVQKP